MEATKNFTIFVMLLLSTLFTSAVVLTRFLSKKIVIPLTVLDEAMNDVEHGKLGVQVKVAGNNEISRISEAFNRMSTENARMYQELETINITLEQKVEERIWQLKIKNEELSRLAVKDELTQLTNRRGFDKIFEHEWFSAVRAKQPLSVAMIDIDYFKQYNDTYGHQAGDECIKKVAERIYRNAGRANDISARYGGEEFVVIFSGTPLEGAIYVAELIRKDVMDAHIPHESSILGVVTISVGVACMVPDKREGRESLLKQADKALYDSKNRLGSKKYLSG